MKLEALRDNLPDAKTENETKQESAAPVGTAEDAVAAAFLRAEEICTKHAEHHRRGGSSEEIVNACLYLAGRMRYEREHGR